MSSEEFIVERLGDATGGQGVLRLKGPLTFESLSNFQNAIRREDAATVILDLTEVPYVDSAGLGSLVSTYVTGQKAGRRVILTGVNDRVLKLFEITRVEPLFLIFPTVWDAIEALTGAGRA
ncbi:MAG: STAS domain-containing protein [Acidobacteriia bacterium]|nr:STAS domain-containing protein [Terriglobia bacterium]